MSARKTRPAIRTPVTADMSRRDMAAAIGVSTAELHRWGALAALPEAEFERRMAAHKDAGKLPTATSIISMNQPAPARGRVQRATAIYRNMTPAERGEFLAQIGVLQ